MPDDRIWLLVFTFELDRFKLFGKIAINFLLMNSPPSVNDIDRIISDAILWQTNLMLQNENLNVSSIHEIVSVEINGERISRTFAFARHLLQKRDCRFLRFLDCKRLDFNFLPLTKFIIVTFGHWCWNLLFVRSTGLLKVHLIFCHWRQQFHQTEQSRRYWFPRWCRSVSFAPPLPKKQHHHKSYVLLWLVFEDRCSRHLLLMPDWAAVLQNLDSRAQTAAFFWSCQILVELLLLILFFRIICCENHIALMYKLAVFDFDFLNFSWGKSKGETRFDFAWPLSKNSVGLLTFVA